MSDFWTIITQFFKSIFDFLDWYIEDTPLFEDTLNSLYEVCLSTGRIIGPLIAEYIQYISEYFNK